MSELIMLVGLPGSGKSTYIKKINADGKYAVISSDDILDEIAAEKGLSYSEAWSKYVGNAASEMMRRAKAAVKNDKPIIWDQTNLTPKSRKKAFAILPAHYDAKAVVFSIDDLELKRRLDKRAKETGKVIPDHVMKDMSRRYVAPTKSEGFSEIKYIKN